MFFKIVEPSSNLASKKKNERRRCLWQSSGISSNKYQLQDRFKTKNAHSFLNGQKRQSCVLTWELLRRVGLHSRRRRKLF